MNNNNMAGLDGLAVLSDILQIFNYVENSRQTKNDEIMQELQHQNAEYLELIIKQNAEILERLKNV